MRRLAVVVALVAAACGTGEAQVDAPPLVTSTAPSTVPPSTAAPTSAPSSTTEPAAPLPPVVIEQVDCPAPLRNEIVACGVATVPLDRSDGAAGTTVITLATVTGSDPTLTTPAAVLQGGPGGASSEMAGWFPPRRFTQVFVDQRGTGFVGSELNCVEFDTAVVDLLVVDSATATTGLEEALAACAARLADNPDLLTADTATHAGDVADVMAALGYDRWVAYGVSYGSTIGLELMRDEPAGLVGVVLDALYPPEIDVDAGVAFSAANAIAELEAACSSDPECAALTDDLSGLLDDLILELDAEPISVDVRARDIGADEDVTVVLDGQRLAEFTFTLLYSESRLRFLPAALAGIAEGDTDAAEWLARTGARALISAYLANDEGTFYSVQCRERLPFVEGVPDDLDPFAARMTSGLLSESCAVWDREPSPPEVGEPVVSDLPALLLSGPLDPITPPAYAELVAPRLGGATVVTREGRTHGIWFGDDCIAAIVEQFVVDPTRELDTSCADVAAEIEWARP